MVKEAPAINLTDIIPLMKVSTTKTKSIETTVREYVSEWTDMHNLLKLSGELLGRADEVAKWMKDKNLLSKLSKKRLEFLMTNHYLPPEMKMGNRIDWYALKDEIDLITRLADCSLISGADVKSIADKFGFVVLPFTCLARESYKNEHWQKVNEIENFAKITGANIYVISPIEYYSIHNHVKLNVDESPIYTGRHSSVFTSITITIPMFRTMTKDIEDLRTTTNQNFESVKVSINQMQTSITNLQKQVDKQNQEIVAQALNLQRMEAQIQQMRLRAIDPIMIAFDKSVSIGDDAFDSTACFVGPCWGPDFDANLAQALDLKIIKNQRGLLSKKSSSLWN